MPVAAGGRLRGFEAPFFVVMCSFWLLALVVGGCLCGGFCFWWLFEVVALACSGFAVEEELAPFVAVSNNDVLLLK